MKGNEIILYKCKTGESNNYVEPTIVSLTEATELCARTELGHFDIMEQHLAM